MWDKHLWKVLRWLNIKPGRQPFSQLFLWYGFHLSPASLNCCKDKSIICPSINPHDSVWWRDDMFSSRWQKWQNLTTECLQTPLTGTLQIQRGTRSTANTKVGSNFVYTASYPTAHNLHRSHPSSVSPTHLMKRAVSCPLPTSPLFSMPMHAERIENILMILGKMSFTRNWLKGVWCRTKGAACIVKCPISQAWGSHKMSL